MAFVDDVNKVILHDQFSRHTGSLFDRTHNVRALRCNRCSVSPIAYRQSCRANCIHPTMEWNAVTVLYRVEM